MKLPSLQSKSLSRQMALSFVGITLLSILAAWLPEAWLVQAHFEDEAWARLEQGRRTAQARYRAWQNEVTSAALLSAQLPTLREQVARRDEEALASYLETVGASLNLNLVVVCDEDGRVLAATGDVATEEFCALETTSGYHVTERGTAPVVWMLASQIIRREGRFLGSVLVALRLDDAFASQMEARTGLEHTLLVDGRPAATSIPAGVSYWERVEVRDGGDGTGERVFAFEGNPYYATRLSLDNGFLEDEIALAATNLVRTQRTVARTGIASLILVCILGSVLGLFAARRIGRPLIQLSEAAAGFSEGDLTSPLTVDSDLHEVRSLATALEQARVDLRQMVTSLQEEKAWIENLLQAIVEGIMTLDDEGRITFFSKGAERITGWQREEVIGRRCNEVLRTTESEESFRQLIPEPEEARRIWVEMADGRSAALSVTRAELAPPEAGAARVAIVFRDVSEEEMYQQLITHFLANVTHEFRTPLTALGASVELMLDQQPDLTQDEMDRMLNWLHLGILNLQTLVDNLLESASLEAGRFRISPRSLDLGEVIAEAAQIMQPLLEKYEQRLTVSLPQDVLPVHADPQRVIQVLVNLISNAHKYGPEGSEIKLVVASQREAVHVAVIDQGPGVPPHERDRLFHRFVQADTRSDRGKYGVGLGLWVARAIVEAHGGKMGVDAAPEGGARFWFTLPTTEIGDQ